MTLLETFPIPDQEAQNPLAGKRVIICEDEAITQMQLYRALTRAGMAVVGTATNGRSAIEAAERHEPDIVLMDIQMPVMDGLEAAQRILEVMPVCITMLTAYGDDRNMEMAHAIGASGYLLKPIDSEMLAPALEQAWHAFHERRSQAGM